MKDMLNAAHTCVGIGLVIWLLVWLFTWKVFLVLGFIAFMAFDLTDPDGKKGGGGSNSRGLW